MSRPPLNDHEIEQLLSQPTPGAIAAVRQLEGDVMVLGVGGKMGTSLAVMLRRALDAAGRKATVYGVSRFSRPAAKAELEACGVTAVSCDLADTAQVARLPPAANVEYLAGQKFGTESAPDETWIQNTIVPSLVAQQFRSSRIVVFSTGCVYPLVPVASGGSREDDPVGPPGDYANSCVGRERIFQYFSKKNGTPVAIYRLNYAIDLRYGVLIDLAQKILAGEEIDVAMGHVNILWQRDANARALQCLAIAASPAVPINITGPETLAVRDLANQLGKLLGKPAKVVGKEAPTAWLNNAGKSSQLFGQPSASVEQMLVWVADWVKRGGATLNKPTHFEARDGKF